MYYGHQGLSWTLTLHAISNSTKSRMILLTQVLYMTCTGSAHVCTAYCTVLHCDVYLYRECLKLCKNLFKGIQEVHMLFL